MAEKTRNSSIELLRMICIFGIIFMHTIAYGGDKLAFYNRYIQIVVNCATNLGVTCFMLISGYFGVRFQLEKLIRLDLMVIFYSVINLVIRLLLKETIGGMDVLCTVFPILSNQYWYLTAYFIIVVFSGWLNQIPEKMSQTGFRKLLLLLVFLFAVVPTFLTFDILGSEGKNVVYMALLYLIGRYIRKYGADSCNRGRAALLLAGNLLLTLALETALFFLTGRYSLFYRDCSVFTLVSSILLFLIFKSVSFYSRAVNRIATGVLAVYVFSAGFQKLVHVLLPLEDYAFSPLLFPLICIFAPCVVAGCIIVDLLRQTLFGSLEGRLAAVLEDALRKLLLFVKKNGNPIYRANQNLYNRKVTGKETENKREIICIEPEGGRNG